MSEATKLIKITEKRANNGISKDLDISPLRIDLDLAHDIKQPDKPLQHEKRVTAYFHSRAYLTKVFIVKSV
jgi:hypothetical protein